MAHQWILWCFFYFFFFWILVELERINSVHGFIEFFTVFTLKWIVWVVNKKKPLWQISSKTWINFLRFFPEHIGVVIFHRFLAFKSWKLEVVGGHSNKGIFGVDVIHRYVLDGLCRRVCIVVSREMIWLTEHCIFWSYDAILERDHISLLHTSFFKVAWLKFHFQVVQFALRVWAALSELLFVVLVYVTLVEYLLAVAVNIHFHL